MVRAQDSSRCVFDAEGHFSLIPIVPLFVSDWDVMVCVCSAMVVDGDHLEGYMRPNDNAVNFSNTTHTQSYSSLVVVNNTTHTQS